MTSLAQCLVVGWFPKQRPVTFVRLNMVHHHCRCQSALIQAAHAKRMVSQIYLPILPPPSIISPGSCTAPIPILLLSIQPLVFLAVPALADYLRTSWIPARPLHSVCHTFHPRPPPLAVLNRVFNPSCQTADFRKYLTLNLYTPIDTYNNTYYNMLVS